MIRRDPNQTTRWPFWAFMVVVVCLIYQDLFGVVKDDNIEDNLHLWLKKNSLSFVVEMLKRDGITNSTIILLTKSHEGVVNPQNRDHRGDQLS
jgi:hypothetical protein